jgi:hypothetical protein
MPAERAPMRCVREIFRLKHACGASDRAIARSTGVARNRGLEPPGPDQRRDLLEIVEERDAAGRGRRGEPGGPCATRRSRDERGQ